MKIHFALLILFCLFVNAVPAQNSVSINEMVAAEKAFAAFAADKGTKAAFLQYAAENGLIFNPKPANAREVWSTRPESSGFLAWTPAFAGIASTCEMGFTTGPSEFRPKGKTDVPNYWGEFATIWKKQPDGTWKWVLDIGIQHAKPDNFDFSSVQPVLLPTAKNVKQVDSNYWRQLENEFAAAIGKNGVPKIYNKFASEQIRLLRQNHFPFDGKKETLKTVAVENGSLKITPLIGEAVSDLAYVYGEYELSGAPQKNDKGQYLRVWRREGKDWRIVLDLAKPFPPAGK